MSTAASTARASPYGPLEDAPLTAEEIIRQMLEFESDGATDSDSYDPLTSPAPGSLGPLDLLDLNLESVDAELTLFQRDPMVAEALSNGVDLGGYASEIDAALRAAEDACVAESLAQAEELAALLSQITQCDATLVKM